MTDKESNMPTNPELIIDYIDQLKEDNKRLKEELKAEKRPLFDFTSSVQLIRDVADHGFTITAFVVSIILAIILAIYGLVCMSGPNGKYYVTRKGTYSISSKAECKQPRPVIMPCFKVMGEFDIGPDDYVDGCFSSKEKAYEAAREFTDEWKKLHNE